MTWDASTQMEKVASQIAVSSLRYQAFVTYIITSEWNSYVNEQGYSIAINGMKIYPI